MSSKVMGLLAGFVLVVGAATLGAETVSKKFTFANNKTISLDMASEGVTLKEIRFDVEGGVNWNPLRAGVGPQCFVQLKNNSSGNLRLAVAVALYDDKGDLIAATESTHVGNLEAGESSEMKLTFKDVKRRFFEAKTGQIALETYK